MSDNPPSTANIALLLKKPFSKHNEDIDRPRVAYSRLNSSPSSSPITAANTLASPYRSPVDTRRGSMPTVALPLPTLSTSPIGLSRSPLGPNFVLHQVQVEDTLQGLALKYGVTVEDLKRRNRLWTSKDLLARHSIEIPLGPSRPVSRTNSIEEGPDCDEIHKPVEIQCSNCKPQRKKAVSASDSAEVNQEMDQMLRCFLHLPPAGQEVPVGQLIDFGEEKEKAFEEERFFKVTGAVGTPPVGQISEKVVVAKEKDVQLQKRKLLEDRNVESPRSFFKRTDNQIQLARQRLASFSKAANSNLQ